MVEQYKFNFLTFGPQRKQYAKLPERHRSFQAFRPRMSDETDDGRLSPFFSVRFVCLRLGVVNSQRGSINGRATGNFNSFYAFCGVIFTDRIRPEGETVPGRNSWCF